MAVSISPNMANNFYYSVELRRLKVISTTSTEVTLTVSAKYANVAYTQLFTSTYRLSNSQVEIYDISTLVEQYIEERNLKNICKVKIVLQGDVTDDTATYEFNIIYSKHELDVDAKNIVNTQFLTTALSRLVSYYSYDDCIYFYATMSTVTVETSITVKRQNGSITTYTKSRRKACTISEYNSIDCSLSILYIDREVYGFPETATVLSYTIKVGSNIIARFYVAEPQRALYFHFRNKFMLPECAYIPVETVVKTKTTQSIAQYGTQLVAYDREHVVEYECQTAELTQDTAHWLTEMLQSHYVNLYNPDADQSKDIIITEYTSELSDEPAATTSLKFKIRFADTAADGDAYFFEQFNRIFTKQYDTKFQQ